jgi:RNA polymerase sigma factor (sigma-70 family)
MVQPQDELIPTRATLIQRLKNWQDHASWQDFFDTYWRLIFTVAIQAGLTEVEAQDVVQETMFSVARHMPSFKYNQAQGSFKTWLLTMTRWRIMDQIRRRESLAACRPFFEETATGTRTVDKVADPSTENLDALWDAQWEETLLEAAITNVKRSVDPQKYQVFDLYVKKEWAADKVAEAFGITVSQVYLAKHRISEMIKEEVNRLTAEVT